MTQKQSKLLITAAIIFWITLLAIAFTSCASARRQSYVEKYNTQYTEVILNGNVAKGMSKREVIASWGQPERKSESLEGVDIWTYGSVTLIFEDNHVKDWRTYE